MRRDQTTPFCRDSRSSDCGTVAVRVTAFRRPPSARAACARGSCGARPQCAAHPRCSHHSRRQGTCHHGHNSAPEYDDAPTDRSNPPSNPGAVPASHQQSLLGTPASLPARMPAFPVPDRKQLHHFLVSRRTLSCRHLADGQSSMTALCMEVSMQTDFHSTKLPSRMCKRDNSKTTRQLAVAAGSP
jgi:hypothetical protein